MNVCAGRSTILPGVVQVPLGCKLRIIWRRSRLHDVVGFGVQNVGVLPVLAQGGLNRNILTELHDLQPLTAVELTHAFASGCAVSCRHRCPSSAWPTSHEHPVGSVLGSLGAIHDSREHARSSLPTSLCEQRDSAERSHEQEDQTESTERDTDSLLSELR